MADFDALVVARALTGGMGVHAFDADLREQRAACFAGAMAGDQLTELIDLAALEDLLASGALPLTSVDLYQDGHLIRLADMQKKSGKTGLALVAERFHDGATIRLRDIDRVDRRLGEFAAAVRSTFSAGSQINVYLTPPAKAGFPPHFDITDVFIVQCLGRKQWHVYTDYTSRVDLPLAETNWEPDRFRPVGSPDAMTLSAGDVLYLPRGVMHEAFCTDRASMHLTISITPLTFVDLLARELQRAAAADVRFRRRVPWSFEGDAPDVSARMADTARECLQRLAAQIDVAATVAEERRTMQADGPASRERVGLSDAIGHLFDPMSRAESPVSAGRADSPGTA